MKRTVPQYNVKDDKSKHLVIFCFKLYNVLGERITINVGAKTYVYEFDRLTKTFKTISNRHKNLLLKFLKENSVNYELTKIPKRRFG